MKAKKSIWTFVATVLVVGGTAVVKHFGYFSESPQKAQETEQPANTASTSATGIEEPIPNEQKRLVSQNNIQEMGDGNINSPQTMGEGNKVDISSETNEIEKQVNTERNIETRQYNENSGIGNTNCLDSNAPCGNNGTNNFNPAQ